MEKKQLERYWLHIIKEQRNRGTGEFWHSIGKRLERGLIYLLICVLTHAPNVCRYIIMSSVALLSQNGSQLLKYC